MVREATPTRTARGPTILAKSTVFLWGARDSNPEPTVKSLAVIASQGFYQALCCRARRLGFLQSPQNPVVRSTGSTRDRQCRMPSLEVAPVDVTLRDPPRLADHGGEGCVGGVAVRVDHCDVKAVVPVPGDLDLTHAGGQPPGSGAYTATTSSAVQPSRSRELRRSSSCPPRGLRQSPRAVVPARGRTREAGARSCTRASGRSRRDARWDRVGCTGTGGWTS
jgi:hypothetical protein